MATIVNTPGSGDGQNSSTGWIVAVIVLIVALLAAFYFFSNKDVDQQLENNEAVVPATVEDRNADAPTIFNTTVNSTTTVTNSTTTVED